MSDKIISVEDQIIDIISNTQELNMNNVNDIIHAINQIKRNYKTDYKTSNNLYNSDLFEWAPVFTDSDYWNDYISKLNKIIDNFQTIISCFNMKYRVYSFFDNNHNDDIKLHEMLSDTSIKTYSELDNMLHEIEEFISCVWNYVKLSHIVSEFYKLNQNIEVHKIYRLINNYLNGFIKVSKIKCTINFEVPSDNVSFDDLKQVQKDINEALIVIKRYFYRNNKQKNNIEYSNDIISVPLILQKASAGIGRELTAEIDIADMVSFPADDVPTGATHAIIIDGDSMEPEIHNGQTVFIKLGQQCNDGDYGIFAVTMNYMTEVYCKQYKYDKNGKPYLHSVNKAAGDPEFREDDNCVLSCVGKILGL